MSTADAFLPFARPSISEDAINEVVACLKSGWLTTGPRVQQFTEDLKAYFDAPYALPLASATAGLHLCLLALGLNPDDEVITTPLTYVATLNTIALAGGTPVLVDIDPLTYNMNVDLIEQAITPRTKAIVPVHFAGLAVDLEPIYELARQYQLRVIEDAAHAIGTEYKQQRIGAFGDTQVFSFYANKNMTTGEGGVVVTRDAELARQIELLRFHGIDRAAWNRYGKNGSQDFEVLLPGFKYNMMDLQAALGIHQLKELPIFLEKRARLANRYLKVLADWPQWRLPKAPDYAHTHAWHLFSPVLQQEHAHVTREEFMHRMKEKNIGTGLHYRPAHLYSYYQERFGFHRGQFPHAEHVGDHIVSLPLFPDMTDHDHDRVIDVMYHIFNS